ncbi:hypothetical protein ABFX02_02G104700 [Erythranthe guttata]
MASVKILPLFLVVLFVLLADINRVSAADEAQKIFCCYDNHIGQCNPGMDDERCDQLCRDKNCSKGGFCKVFKHKPPNHYCHCYC